MLHRELLSLSALTHGSQSWIVVLLCVYAFVPILSISVSHCSGLATPTTEGKYHLVKRMLAAAGNRVEWLSRVRVGGLNLPGDLGLGQWKWLEVGDLELLSIYR